MKGIVRLLTPRYQLFPEYLVNKCFIISKEISDAKIMAEGKIIDVAVKKTSTGYNINHK